MRFVKITILIICATVLFSHFAYADNPIEKLGRGIANLLTGWIEIPKEMIALKESEGDISGLLVGPFSGLWKALVRTSAGAYEIVTFPFPFPVDYEPVVEPEYVLSNY